jgi:hypothetical protein
MNVQMFGGFLKERPSLWEQRLFPVLDVAHETSIVSHK